LAFHLHVVHPTPQRPCLSDQNLYLSHKTLNNLINNEASDLLPCILFSNISPDYCDNYQLLYNIQERSFCWSLMDSKLLKDVL
jgi:hypothetical protein